jgi:hypothetical protein
MSTELVYTDQTALTAMRNHILSMTERCYSDVIGSCVYNGWTSEGEENHCVVGALITGIKLANDENIGSIDLVIDKNPEVKKRIGKVNIDLMKACQGIHDNAEYWRDESDECSRKEAFDAIALRFNLKVEEAA